MIDLKFSPANAKTHALAKVPALSRFLCNKRKIFSFDILSGYSCPFALECLSKVVKIDGKSRIRDGKDMRFRCFSATQELVYKNVYLRRKANFDSLRSLQSSEEFAKAIESVMPHNLGICRIHVSGDMFNRQYMLGWAMLAEKHKDRLFYAYTKSLPYWIKFRNYFDSLDNFVLTASRGGRADHLIDEYGLREAKVVFTEKEAKQLKLQIDHNDSHAANPTKKRQSFALLIHGVQPAGSDASKALVALKGKGSYSR